VSFATVKNDDIRLFQDLFQKASGASPRIRGGTLLSMGKGPYLATVSLGVLAALVSVDAQVGSRRLTIDDIYNPTRRINFSGTPETAISWLDPATYISRRRVTNGVEWLKVDAASGDTSPLFEASAMEAALASLPGVTRDEASMASRSDNLIFNPARTATVVTIADDLYFYGFTSSKADRLTTAPGEEEIVTFSPDGRMVAFVRNNNLHVVDVTAQRERAITTDGSPERLNGKLDWLYQEEIYGRGNFRGYWWSPDSSRLAFLQLDERPVPEYTVVDHIPYRPALEVTDYPKAGDPNPVVKLGVARIEGSRLSWVDLSSYSAVELLIVNVGWSPDSQHVVHQVQNREQTWLDLNLADVSSGRTRRLIRETTPAWVNENGNPVWLKDGSFLWLSERSGFKHLYRYSAAGEMIAQVTNGRWDVRTLYGVDESRGALYFTSPERSSITTDIYRIGLDGTGMTRLSQRAGTNRAIFNPDFTRFVGIWSNVATPTQVRLHRADGTEARVIDANAVSALAEFKPSTPEFVQVKTRDGFVMDGMLIKPPDFTPSGRYPVYQFTYAGPGAAQVRDQWGGTDYMFHQMLAQHGIVVWILDNRSASGKGAESQWPVYGRLGELELQDLEDGVTWLKQQTWVDPSRLVLSGWSYGGFMTAYALTHSTSWSAGIVGAPVTDWRDYDTVYTERLMKLPQNNADGYRRTAPRFAADRLNAQMLLIHGTMDDNVHMQNSIQFAYELQKAGKPFEMMVYARQRHGFGDSRLVQHLHQTMFDFVTRVTQQGNPASASSR
jgi:dipeptidyl-peptidase-4